MEYYNLKNKVVWYNPYTRRVFHKKTINCIRFDSLGEYNLYKNLNNFFIDNLIDATIKVHNKLYIGRNKFWVIDFSIRFEDVELNYFKNLLKYINKVNDIDYLKNNLYIEYKGVLNKGYIDKQKTLIESASELNNKIIVLSSSPKALLIESEKLNYNIKYIHSTNYFFEVLNKCLELR